MLSGTVRYLDNAPNETMTRATCTECGFETDVPADEEGFDGKYWTDTEMPCPKCENPKFKLH